MSNDEMEDIMKLIECSSLLLKGFSQRIQSKAKEQKGGFLSILLGILVASLLDNFLAGKGMNRAREEIVRAGYGSSIKNKDF